jgi:uncharacterized damage-inducible protein DinB
MGSEGALARAMLEEAHRTLSTNIEGISLEEALEAAGGYRSILGILKHVAGWNAVYYSYAFDPEPRHWKQTDWPRGLRDRIEPTEAYLLELVDWFEAVSGRWLERLSAVEDLGAHRPVHWGDTAPLGDIVAIVAAHWLYHAGEINAILAIRRGEAWEHLEEVEENHILTVGHRVRPPWMTDAEWATFVRKHPEAMP